jgi:signal transduction histidine kinase
MPTALSRRPHRPPRSLTRRDLVPDLAIATGTVVAAALLRAALLPWLGHDANLTFALAAAAVTFWAGFGPGLITATIGTLGAGSLFLKMESLGAPQGSSALVAQAVIFGEAMIICWMIYRVRVGQEHAEAAHQQRDESLTFIAHELRHPLATIQMGSTMLQRHPDERKRDRAAVLIARSAARLSRLVDDLVDVNRIKSGDLTVQRDVIVLQEMVRAATDAAALAMSTREQVLQITMPPDPVRVWGDSLRLQQVVANVLANASTYSPDGAEITLAMDRRADMAAIVVRDTGLGIRPEMLQRIFDPFVRESDTAGGLGVGLTLARSLVERHGGQITAASDGPGRGSTFEVLLPALPAEAPQLPAHATVSV